MVNPEGLAFIPLESFSLKWRWTDGRWNKLPSESLSRIRPLSEQNAVEFVVRFGSIYDDRGALREGKFSDIRETRADWARDGEVSRWLASLPIKMDTGVIVSWDRRFAALTDWEIFSTYWDDFCYPASDDVAIVPLDEKWALLYDHGEHFTFAK